MKKNINYFDGLEDQPSPVLQEIAVMPGIGSTISVRSAKAHLSALLDLVASGREITITSGGKPKAVIASVCSEQPKRPGLHSPRSHARVVCA